MVAGGGFAGLEAVLAVRAIAGTGLRVTMISPSRVFSYRPAAPLEVFSDALPLRYDLRAMAEDLGVALHGSRLEAAAPAQGWVRLQSGARIGYDALILAIGVRARSGGVPGALTFRDQRDLPLLRGLVEEIDSGRVGGVTFVVPSGCAWPLPLYELALLMATRARERRLATRVTLVSPERSPLAVFGARASRLVAGLLDDRGVRFLGGALAARVRRDGSLTLQSGVAVCRRPGRGRAPAARPADHGRARERHWADAHRRQRPRPRPHRRLRRGRHDHLPGQASRAGCSASRPHRPRDRPSARLRASSRAAGYVLEARLVGGARPIVLRTVLDELGRPTIATLQRPQMSPPTPAVKVSARYLSPYLQTRRPADLAAEPPHPRRSSTAPRREPPGRAAGGLGPRKNRTVNAFEIATVPRSVSYVID